MRKWLCIFFFLSLTLLVNGQTITGKVVDEQQNPMQYANIVLLSMPDSTFIQGTISDPNGVFKIVSDGNKGLLRISSVGYVTLYKSCNDGNLGIIQLTSDAQMLGEVVVKGDLPQTRLKGSSMLTGVAGTILEKAGTAENLLDKIPGVSAGNGNVKVFGRGTPEVYINGRKVQDSSELDKLASDNIQSVEVINNPGARYKASVKAVIRITTKKAVGDGLGIYNRFNTTYKYGWSVLDQFNFNYRKNGFDLSGMLYGANGHSEQNKTVVQRTYLDKQWNQFSDITNRTNSQQISAMLSLNYQFNKDHVLGMRYDYDRKPKDYWKFGMPTTVYQDNELYEESANNSIQDTRSTNHRTNFYYNGKVGEWNIDFNADGVWDESKNPAVSIEINETDGIKEQRTVTTYSQIKNSLYAAKVIVSYPFWEGNLVFGSEYSHTSRMNRYANVEGILDNDDSNIIEGIWAAFLEYNRSFGRVDVQAGIRYENVQADYYEYNKKVDEQSKVYNNVFPSLAFSFPINKVQMQLSYAADISRPSYGQLRGNITYGNRYTYESGNPFLKPTISHSLILGSSYKWAYFSLGYQHIKDGMINLSSAYSEKDATIALLSWMNADDYDKIYAQLFLQPKIGKWSPRWGASILKQWYMADTPEGKHNFNHSCAEISWKNSIELPAGILLGADASFSTRGHNENVTINKISWGVNLSLYKQFMKKRFTCYLQGIDIFNTRRDNVTLYSGIRTMQLDTETRRRIVLTVRYAFNNTKSKYRGTGAGSLQKSRM